MNAIVPLADGFEELEAVTIIDILRRVNISVTTLFLQNNPVIGSHNIAITADANIDDISSEKYSLIVLPGGQPGSTNLKNDARIISLIKEICSTSGYAAALCAAPIVLAASGVLEGKKATCYPGYEAELKGATVISDTVVHDGNVITSKGPGTAIPFVLKIIEIIISKETALEAQKRLQVYWM